MDGSRRSVDCGVGVRWLLPTLISAVLAVAGCGHQPANDASSAGDGWGFPSNEQDRQAAEKIQESFAAELCERDVRAMLKHAAMVESSICYLQLNWSVDSVIGESRFARFALEYQREAVQRGGNNVARLHVVPCTNLRNHCQAVTELRGWDDDRHQIAGSGAVMWLKAGRVVHVERIGNFATVEDMIAKTDALFGH